MADRSGSTRHVVLVTYDARPDLTDDDRLLADALAARGAVVDAAPWSDGTVRWHEYDAVVVRSTWDYFLRADEFHAWLARLERERARVFNDVHTLRWNADKTYLRDLGVSGIPIIPTCWLERGSASSLGDLRRATGWSELVVKPTVSGGAHRTWRASPAAESDDDSRLTTMIDDGAVMVQPLVDEVEREGEWSLLFFDGRYSHAVLKRPRTGDFRVQREHGGSLEPAEPGAGVIAAALRVLDAVPLAGAPPLYARVDGCVVENELLLMELELLEPELFLRCSAGAAERLAEALLSRMR
jgi:glutathione synthase/RimK-type ligase-like ATP-grasp enzyme